MIDVSIKAPEHRVVLLREFLFKIRVKIGNDTFHINFRVFLIGDSKSLYPKLHVKAK